MVAGQFAGINIYALAQTSTTVEAKTGYVITP